MTHIIIFKDESVYAVDDVTEHAIKRFLAHATNRGETHWDGCEWHHHACALAKLAQAQDEISLLKEQFQKRSASGDQLIDALCKSIDENGYDETIQIIQKIGDEIAGRKVDA